VLARDRGICHICGRPGADTADHLDPVSEHGPGIPPLDRLAAAHRSCNSRRARLLEQQAQAPERELEEELGPPPPRERPSGYREFWHGAIDIPLDGPAIIHKPGGITIRVERGERYIP
jgi:hypothetical protein